MNVQLLLTPAPMGNVSFKDKTVVVIDVLRSSTSICAILNAGARGVIPTAEPGEAGDMWTKVGPENAVLAGERNGVKIENFQFGNSPREFDAENVGGKLVIICTTNGTAPFGAAGRAKTIFSGAFTNISSVAEAVARENRDLIVICSGHEGGFSTEDTLCGGMLLDLLKRGHDCAMELNDAAALSMLFFDTHKTAVPETVAKGEHGRFLTSIGFGDDVAMAAEVDSMPVVAILQDGRLVLADGQVGDNTE